MRWQPQGEKTDIKMGETLSFLRSSQLLHRGVEREVVFPLLSFQRRKLDKTIYFNHEDLRTRGASRYFEYQIIPKVVVFGVVVFFLHTRKCVFVREWQKAKFKNKSVARRCSLELLPLRSSSIIRMVLSWCPADVTIHQCRIYLCVFIKDGYYWG